MSSNSVIISLGSNIDPHANIPKSLTALQAIATITQVSELVETAPQIFKDQPNFLNGAVLIETKLNYTDLNAQLKEIEKRLGRIKTSNKHGPRPIDLDIVVFNGEITDEHVFEWDFLTKAVLSLAPNLANT